MKKSIACIATISAALILSSCSESGTTAGAEDSADEGWVSLFDGKTLEGWKKSTLGSANYKVVDGTIHGETVEGSPNTFLMSENQYGNFELEFEVKVHDSLNSGCQIRSREKKEEDLATTGKNGKPAKDINRFFGPQVELESSPGQSGYIYGEATGRGWISPEPADKEHSHDFMKNGEWNQIRIVANGVRIQTFINGNAVADLSDSGIFESHPRGHIGLQVHGIKKGTGPFDVAWKNIRIKELK